MDRKTRTIVGFCFIAVIVISIIAVLLNWDKAFSYKVDVVYPDGCNEKFVNGELITPKCTNGRLLEQQATDDSVQLSLGDPQFNK